MSQDDHREIPLAQTHPPTELWSISRVASYLKVTESGARTLLSDRNIKAVSGYPADAIRAIVRRRGARNDLPQRPPAAAENHDETRVQFGPLQLNAIRCLTDGEVWTATRIAIATDPVKDSDAAISATKTLMTAALTHLHDRGFAEPSGPDGWHITAAGRDAFDHRAEQ